MIDHEWVVMFNRVGLILNFLSFWFIAPEILGEERLRRIDRWFESVVKGIVETTGCLTTFIGMVVLGSIGYGLLFYGLVSNPPSIMEGCVEIVAIFIIVVIIAALVEGGLKKLYQRVTSFAELALRRLADNSKTRQRSMILGAVIFVVGTIFQLLGTL